MLAFIIVGILIGIVILGYGIGLMDKYEDEINDKK
jgi:hypothetical protein